MSAGEREPVAVIAMGCRLPGGVTSPEEFWTFLAEGREGLSDFPDDRGWDVERLRSADVGLPGVSTPHRGGFLSGAAGFDPALFGISPREALAMDPQQRLLLEVSWETLERAGIAPTSLRGEPVGVFTGTAGQDYLTVLQRAQDRAAGHTLTGTAGSVMSGRVAYALGLRGPAITVDTASSASLVAIHLACRALAQGDCTLALAGGATVMSTPAMFVEYSKLRGLAPDGVAKPFSAAADGTAWAEGVGVVLLARLSDALAQGHPVLAVIRGSAVNQDGASDGLTAPNGRAQQQVLGQALADAGLSPADVDAVEAHGTGTALGDPVEAEALLAVYGPGRRQGSPLYLGSVKSNFGHAQAAAGVAGLIKMVLSLTHGVLPRTLHAAEPTPHVDWCRGELELLHEARPWPSTGRPRRAAVSSFGISGTNAHLVLEEAPRAAARTPGPGVPPDAPGRDAHAVPDGAVAWVVSARGAQALHEQARRLRSWAAVGGAPPTGDTVDGAAVGRHRVTDVAGALARGRAQLEHRGVVIAPDGHLGQLLDGLHALAEGEPAPGVVEGVARGDARLAVLFTGQGAQRLGMGRELRCRYPVFAQAFDAACAALDRELAGHVPEPVADVVFGVRPGGEEVPDAAELLNRTVYTQAGLFALETALFRLVQSWGVRPRLLGGHSIGEVVAAHAAGVLSLRDASRLVAARGRLMQNLPEGGAMAALEATEAEALELIGTAGDVGVAAVNAPDSVVISGTGTTVVSLARVWRTRGRKAKRLRVSHAFHSPRMEPMLDAFLEELQALSFHAPRLPVVSNVTGSPATEAELTSPDYWVRHVRQAVRFGDGVNAMAGQGASVFLELGPDGVLSGLGPEALAARDAAGQEPVFAAALRVDRPEHASLLAALGQIWVHGIPVDWAAVTGGTDPAVRVDLPTYAFQRGRYWAEPEPSAAGDVTAAGLASAGHPVLGAVLELPDSETVALTGRLTARTLPPPVENAAAPASGLLLELAVRAADEAGCARVQDLTIHTPLLPPEHEALALTVTTGPPDANGLRPLTVHSRPDDSLPGRPWTRHATGGVTAADPGHGGPRGGCTGLRAWPPPDAVAQFTGGQAPPAPGVRRLWRRGAETFAEVALPEALHDTARAYGIQPALLQSALDVACLARSGRPADARGLSLSGMELYATGATSLRVRVAPGPDGCTLDAADHAGEPVLSVRGLRPEGHRPTTDGASPDAVTADAADADRAENGPAPREALYHVRWAAAPPPQAVREPGRCALVGTDALGLRGALMATGTYTDAYHDLDALREAIDAGDRVPDSVLILGASVGGTGGITEGGPSATDLCESAGRARRVVRNWCDEERFAATRLVFVTRRAVATRDGEDVPGLLDAALRGVIRSVRDEHPGGVTLLDVDDRPASSRAVAAALSGAPGEFALRRGAWSVPRLEPSARPPEPRELTPGGTVLITGGTGAPGAEVARDLVRRGVRHLLLTGTHASATPEAGALVEELTELGAEVTVADCDVTDAGALAAVLDTVEDAHPVTAVVHTAGAGADAPQDEAAEQVPAGALAAWNLHRLTRGHDLDAFVLFVSADGTFGAPHLPGPAVDACLLDALAHMRRANHRTAIGVSVGWSAGASGEGTAGRREPVRRDDCTGFTPLGTGDVTALLDAALAPGPAAVVLPARVRAGALRARAGELHPLLRHLVPWPDRRVVTTDAAPRSGSALRARLAALADTERDAFLTGLVRDQVAAVLSQASPDDVDTGRSFKDLGLESLSAIEFRNRLSRATGLKLPTTLVRAFPTAQLLVRHLAEQLR
ncbi:type I polyketide synthase [Streptomyces fungicidicus]|uniref:type I polyketide synthase n=1 Tax=Streptomyces fungicidicus TaxID=68203 RepID=UPI0038293663